MNEGEKGMKTNLLAAVAVAAALSAAAAHAQLFKCKGPDGKIVYSDTRCEAGATPSGLPSGLGNRANANDERAASEKSAAEKAAAEAKLQAEARVAAERKADAEARKAAGLPPLGDGANVPQGATGSTAPGRYQLTGRDMERIRNLEIDARRQGAYAEQKTASQLEISSIRSGSDSRLSSDERARLDGLRSDLGSVDAKKRNQALQDLRSLYSR